MRNNLQIIKYTNNFLKYKEDKNLLDVKATNITICFIYVNDVSVHDLVLFSRTWAHHTYFKRYHKTKTCLPALPQCTSTQQTYFTFGFVFTSSLIVS